MAVTAECDMAAVTAECDGGGSESRPPPVNASDGSAVHGELVANIDLLQYKNPKVEEVEEECSLCQFRCPEGQKCACLAEYTVPVWGPQPVPRDPPGRTQSGAR